jgi:hypothetical protein
MSDREIDRDHVKTVCKIGRGAECCRYLMAGGNGFECAKHTTLASVLDNRVAFDEINAKGDNCPGVPAPEVTAETIVGIREVTDLKVKEDDEQL